MKSIAVYCSSSNKVDDIYKEEAKKVGNLLAKKRIRLVYGGGNMGLMGVLSNSAINSGGDVYGVITNHLIEIEKRNNSLNNIKIVETMHERKIEMYNNADAFLIFPGGIFRMVLSNEGPRETNRKRKRITELSKIHSYFHNWP